MHQAKHLIIKPFAKLFQPVEAMAALPLSKFKYMLDKKTFFNKQAFQDKKAGAACGITAVLQSIGLS